MGFAALISTVLLLTSTTLSVPAPYSISTLGKRATTFTYPTFSNPLAKQYHVKTSALPLFNGLDVQDSYAGRISIKNGEVSTFFWYFPSSKAGGSNKLSVWLNGGPGCSSLEGATQETGAFNFEAGTNNPIINPDGWTTVSDMLYIEQPASVGFSTGPTTDLTGEIPLADDFYKFLVAFFNVFSELKSKDFYLTGESYAGFYIPYIAERILHASVSEKAATTINLKALYIIDGVYSDFTVGSQANTARFASQNAAILGFNQTFLEYLNTTSKACGYETMLDAVQYPQPPGNIFLPNPSGFNQAPTNLTCDLFDLFYQEALNHNPCFNVYHITDVCPTPVDPIGGGILYNGTYFNMPEVQAGLNVANSSIWYECSINDPFVGGKDITAFSETVLPDIISQIPVLLVHGDIDAVLFTGGDYVTIQNMTWGGIQGFQKPVTTPLTINGAKGGIWHAERNLTFVEIYDSGHMVPQYQPCLALALFNSMINDGSIGDGKLTVGCSFQETFPVPWPIYSTLNNTIGNGTIPVANQNTTTSGTTGNSTIGTGPSTTSTSKPTATLASSASASAYGFNVVVFVLALLGSFILV